MRTTERDRPPSGWFVVDVMRREARKWDWAALVTDTHPDDLEARIFAKQCWVPILGKHRKPRCGLGYVRGDVSHAALTDFHSASEKRTARCGWWRVFHVAFHVASISRAPVKTVGNQGYSVAT